MRVAVVTPFFETRLDWLERCHRSVRGQSYACTHFLASDGSGENPIPDFSGQFLRLPKAHGDNGNTPRAAASMMAAGQGYDAIAYLDADNYFLPNHIASLVSLHHQTRALVCTSSRTLCSLDGELLGPCGEVDGEHFVDTSCLFITRAAYGLLSEWVLMPREYSPICDFWMWSTTRSTGMSRAHSGLPTMVFTTTYAHHYLRLGQTPPEGCKSDAYSRNCRDKILSLPQHFGDAAASLPYWRAGRN